MPRQSGVQVQLLQIDTHVIGHFKNGGGKENVGNLLLLLVHLPVGNDITRKFA